MTSSGPCSCTVISPAAGPAACTVRSDCDEQRSWRGGGGGVSWRVALLITGAIVACFPQLASAAGCRRAGDSSCADEDDHGDDDDHGGAHFTPQHESRIIIITLSVIFAVSVIFEKFKEFLFESAGKQIAPIVHAMFSELSALGFIALCLFIVIESKGLDDHTKHLVEQVHMILFAILMLYLFLCFVLTRIGTSLGKKWKSYEALADGQEMAAIRGLTLATIMHHEKSTFSRFCKALATFFGGPFRSYDPIKAIVVNNVVGPPGKAVQETIEFKSLSAAEAAVSYLSLRQRFIQMPHKGTSINQAKIKGFEKNFAMNEYLAIAMVEVLIEVVEIPAWAWFGMEIFFIAFYGWLQIAGIAGLAVWIGFGYLLLLSIWLLKRSLSRIEKSLTPQGWVEHAAEQYQIRKRSMALKAERENSPTKHGRKVKVAVADSAAMPEAGVGAASTDASPQQTPRPPMQPNLMTRTNTEGQLETVLTLEPDDIPSLLSALPELHGTSPSSSPSLNTSDTGANPTVAADAGADSGKGSGEEEEEGGHRAGKDGKGSKGSSSSTLPTRRESSKHKEDISIGLDDPPFTLASGVGERANCFSRFFMGAPPSPQESLFWLDRHGPHFCLYIIRLLLVLNAVYVTLLVAYGSSKASMDKWECYNEGANITVEDSAHPGEYITEPASELKPGCGFLIAAGVFPPIIMVLMLGATIQKLVVVTHVEELRSSEKIAKTVRTMKARKALVALKLLTKLKKTTTKTLKRGKAAAAKSEKDIPAPIKTDHVELPSAVNDLSEHLAELAHNDWAETRRSTGWTFGSVRDNAKKVHPELVAWSELPEGSKSWNRNECMSQLKVIVALGFDIQKDPKYAKYKVQKVAREIGKQRTSKVSPEEQLADTLMDPRLEHRMETQKKDIQPHIAQLGEMLAANTHQAWAHSKVKAGWIYGDLVDDEAKTHDLLVPFGDLDDEHQSVNRNQARSSLLAIMNYGFLCVIKKRVLRSVGDRDSVIEHAKSMQNAGPGEIDIDRDDIWKAFAMFDTNGDGFIPSTYILPALKTLGWALTETDAVQIILDMDEMMTGYVEYSAFAGWIVAQENENNDTTDPEELVRAAFAHIDKDNSGNITATELLETLNELGEDLEYEDVQKIVSEADNNDDGHIDIHEFSNLLKDVMEQNF